jgi:hypothetical protein
MSWFRSPVKLFGFTAVLLVLVRLIFPPADFAGAVQVHSQLRFFDFRLDLTGYGFFEFAAFVFALSALAYYLIERLTGRLPNGIFIQLHFWPSLMFAAFSICLAHRVNGTPPDRLHALNTWLTAFNWAFVAFTTFQILFAIGAVRSIWKNSNALVRP